VADTFPDMLKRLVGARFSSARAFVRAAYPPAEEGAGSAYVSQVIKGAKPPPLDRLDTWADALGLNGTDRVTFIDLAALAHLPDSVRGRFELIYAEHRELTKMKDKILKLRK
jgi:hypothetical protein